jgi:penicillin G amidase
LIKHTVLAGLLALPILAATACGGCSDETPDDCDEGAEQRAHCPPPDAGGDDVSGVDADVALSDAVDPDAAEPLSEQAQAILAVPQGERFVLPGLSAPVQVLRVEGNVAHIYGANRQDVARAHGFIAARDRYFMMDLSRRMGLGTISGLLGDAALETDIQARMTGSRYVAERLLAHANEEILSIVEAYVEGVNSYVDHVADGKLPVPSEVDFAYRLLGYRTAAAMLTKFEPIDVMGMLATFVYQSGFETGDIGRQAAYDALEGLFQGATDEELRRAGARHDIWEKNRPIRAIASGDWGAPGAGLLQGRASSTSDSAQTSPVERDLLARLSTSLTEFHEQRLWRDQEKGFGSNAWAVSGAASADGGSLLAGDGHLQLGIPSILYQVGMNTSVFGGGDIEQLGLVIPGFPVIALGTNGKVAWSFTQIMGDITDWYREEIQLDEDGAPVASSFQGQLRPLERIEEQYVIANVALLGSRGRTETLARYQTFDGRWLMDIEGERVSSSYEPQAGETVVRTHSGHIVPRDMDGDGVVNGISFDYVGLDMSDLLGTFDKMGKAQDVYDFREQTRGLLATSLNFTVSDNGGNILYSAFQAVPCRGYLDRDGQGQWLSGADPNLLLDGTRYGGFSIPTRDGRIDEEAGAPHPNRCIVPFDHIPYRFNPDSGYVLTANNDPVGISFDDRLYNGPWYLGGPWDVGFRADTIDRELRRAVTEGQANVAKMAEIQGNHDSRLGETYLPYMLEAVTVAKELAEANGELEPWQQRLVGYYLEEREAIDEAVERLQGWAERGYQAKSGVETFYQTVSEDDRKDAVATSIFNVWFGHFQRGVFDDENLPGIWPTGGTAGRLRALLMFLEGRGSDNPLGLSSWNEETGESVFFDDLRTEQVESSRELVVRGLVQGLAYLRSEPIEPGIGGYGTSNMDAWLWGLRHQVRFESLLASFLRDNPTFASLADQFSITTARLPLAPEMSEDDPRRGLKWFPRNGDHYNVDAANSGINGDRFSYGSGPVMRMVFRLDGDVVEGVNILPGGQSGMTNSPHFDDQARLWLGNKTHPIRFSVADVIAGATTREVFEP